MPDGSNLDFGTLYEEGPQARAARRIAAKIMLSGGERHGHQFLSNWKPYCSDPVQIAFGTDPGCGSQGLHPVEVSFQAPCRKCDRCLFVKQELWKKRAIVEIARSARTWFVTLTFSPVFYAGVRIEANRLTRLEPLAALDSAAYSHVQRYLKRLRKAAGRFRYLATFEEGEKTGRPHYHMLLHETASHPVRKRQLEEQWPSNVHARLVTDSAYHSWYVCKYVTKSNQIRIRNSLNYGN